MDNEALKQYLFTILRNLSAPLVVYLAATGWISEDQATALIVAIISIVLSVVWGLGNKYVFNKQVETALMLPAGSTKEDIKQINEL